VGEQEQERAAKAPPHPSEKLPVSDVWVASDVVAERQDRVVRLDDVLRSERFKFEERQRLVTVGFILALSVLAILLLITVLSLIPLWLTAPRAPSAASMDAQSIAAYKELLQQWNTHAMDVIKLLAAQILLPIITAVLGYLFGSRNREG